MNLRDLSYLTAVARLGHFGKAAEACHVSQPALSSQIKKLEQELGVVLFERDNRHVRQTAAGREIVKLAEEALRVVDNIRLIALGAQQPFSGSFRLGAIPTIMPYLMPEFIDHCQRTLPELDLRCVEDITERLEQELLAGDLDAAILATPPADPRLASVELYDEPFWVIMPDEHPLASHPKSRLTPTDLPCADLLLLSEGHCFREQTLNLFKLVSSPATRVMRANGLETLINMVAAGQGVTLVPAMALTSGWSGDSRITVAPLSDPRAYRRVCLAYRKTDPRAELISELSAIVASRLPDTVTCLHAGETVNREGAGQGAD